MSSFFQKYNLDENEIVEVDTLPLHPTKYIYVYYNDFENTTRMDYQYKENRYAKNKYIYINKDEKLELVAFSYDVVFVKLLLFLKKYRNNPKLLTTVVDSFEISNEKKKLKLKKMQIILNKMHTLEDFKYILKLATETLPFSEAIPYIGDDIIFVNKKEDLGKITNIYGEESFYIKNWIGKYNDTHWYKGVIYNEEQNIYEVCSLPERSNSWSVDKKFSNKEYLFEYLLNLEIQAVGYKY